MKKLLVCLLVLLSLSPITTIYANEGANATPYAVKTTGPVVGYCLGTRIQRVTFGNITLGQYRVDHYTARLVIDDGEAWVEYDYIDQSGQIFTPYQTGTYTTTFTDIGDFGACPTGH